MKCGVDIVSIKRMEQALDASSGERFRAKVFTPAEITYCEHKASRTNGALQSFAARFAAKEAFAKALGTGLGADVSLCEIEVVNDPASGKPSLHLSGNTLARFTAAGFEQIELSLSHEADYAVAFVVIL